MAVQPRDLPITRFARHCFQRCDFHKREKNIKIFDGIKIILKGVITKIQRSRAKFEPEKSNFDATPHWKS